MKMFLNGEVRKLLSHIVEPKIPKRKTKGYIYEVVEYAKNQAKWKAAQEFCEDRMWEFKVLTEDELGIN
jgi:hypothetical protein